MEDRLAPLRETQRCFIWGGGLHTEFLYQITSLFGGGSQREYLIVDSDPIKKDKSWRGIEVHPPEVLRGVGWSGERLLVSTYGGQPSVLKAAAELGVPADRIVCLYDRLRLY